jgi:multidrug resistance protein, MATE family
VLIKTFPFLAGTVELDAHTAMLTLCVFLFISFPFGVATASTIRVGNLLGAGLGQQVGPLSTCLVVTPNKLIARACAVNR